MSLCDNSWVFLEDFYDQDSDIVELCNAALGIRSRISLDGSSKQAFFKSLFSTLDRQQKTYADFVDFVTPESEFAENTNKYDEYIYKLVSFIAKEKGAYETLFDIAVNGHL